jgi:hypothetical protein
VIIVAHVADKSVNICVAIHSGVVASEAMSPHNLLVASKFSPKTLPIESRIAIKIGHFFPFTNNGPCNVQGSSQNCNHQIDFA